MHNECSIQPEFAHTEIKLEKQNDKLLPFEVNNILLQRYKEYCS